MRRLLSQVPGGQVSAAFPVSSVPDTALRRITRPLAAIAGAGLLAGLLGACGVPTAVMVASEAVDGVSYLTTGKSSTDHILSAALNEDCALHRVISGVAVCQDEATDTAVAAKKSPPVQTASLGEVPFIGDAAAAPPAEEFSDIDANADMASDTGAKTRAAPAFSASTSSGQGRKEQLAGMGLGADTFFAPHPGDDAPVSRQVAKPTPHLPASGAGTADAGSATGKTANDIQVAARSAAPVSAITTEPLPAAGGDVVTEKPRFFVVLGSFSSEANARRAAKAVVKGARVAPAMVSGRTLYRVVSGPFERESLTAARRDFTRSGYARAWPVPACTVVSSKGCVSAD